MKSGEAKTLMAAADAKPSRRRSSSFKLRVRVRARGTVTPTESITLSERVDVHLPAGCDVRYTRSRLNCCGNLGRRVEKNKRGTRGRNRKEKLQT